MIRFQLNNQRCTYFKKTILVSRLSNFLILFMQITSRKASKAYLEMVEKSPIGTTLEVCEMFLLKQNIDFLCLDILNTSSSQVR